MSLDLTEQEVDEIWLEAEQHCPPATSFDRLETIYTVPSQLGSGYCREIEICPGLELSIFNETYHDLTLRSPENSHLVQFVVYLSGIADCGDLVLINAEQNYIGGSGIQRRFQILKPRFQSSIGVDIHMQPHLLRQFFAAPTGELPSELQPLVRGDDWQRVFSPKTTGAMRSVVQQIIDCPFMGITKRLYLQGKVIELMALQLDGILPSCESTLDAYLKPRTSTRIQEAAEILQSHLEHPPALADLARQVGIAHCTLIKGFREVFGIAPFAYLTQQRMKQAEHLLRQPDCTVAEVANRVGYANPAQFTAAFKRYFGMTPSECMRGVMSRRAKFF